MRKDSLIKIQELLYLTILKEQSYQQQYVSSVKDDIAKLRNENSGLSCTRTKKILSLRERYQGKSYNKIVFTTRNLAHKFNVSHAKAGQILKSLERSGFIKTKEVIDLISEDYSGPVYGRIGFGHPYTYKGSLYIHRGTGISFISNSSV